MRQAHADELRSEREIREVALWLARFSIIIEADTSEAAADRACEELSFHVGESIDTVTRLDRNGRELGEPIEVSA